MFGQGQNLAWTSAALQEVQVLNFTAANYKRVSFFSLLFYPVAYHDYENNNTLRHRTYFVDILYI
jgi:hypothetical protein